MSSVEIRELKTENDIDTLLSLLEYENETKQRIKTDFNKSQFRSLCAHTNTNESSWLGYLVFCDSYSTWQHRLFFCSDIYLNPSLKQEEKAQILKQLFEELFRIARLAQVHRVNMNINSESDKDIIDMVCNLGAVNLTPVEKWFIFELGFNEMKEFAQSNTVDLNPDYKLIQLDFNNFHLYIDQVINLIREIAIFEKMLDQFETSKQDLERDFKYTENLNRFDQTGKNLSRYYELIVMVKGDEVVGYSIYHLKYELKKGLGFYLEEIFIKDSYRHQGLGTKLWQTVIKDILTNYNKASYLHWTVLEWNKPAIDFYYKFKSINLNQVEKLNHVRFTKPVIYSNNNEI